MDYTDLFKDFKNLVGDDQAAQVFQLIPQVIKFVEDLSPGVDGRIKKQRAKAILRELVDIPNVADWIEDAVISVAIDFFVAIAWPKQRNRVTVP